MTVRNVALALLVAGMATGLLVLLHPLGIDQAFRGLVFAAAVCAIAWHVGLQAVSLCGPLCAAGFISLEWGQYGAPGPATMVPAIGFIVLGLLAGSVFGSSRRLLAEVRERNLELRREVYRLQKEMKESDSSEPSQAREIESRKPAVVRPHMAMPADQAACLDQAVRRISSSLNEPRIIESTLSAVVEVLGASKATIHFHDRKADRFLPGSCYPTQGEEKSIGENDLLLRACLRRRDLLSRDDTDGEFADAFVAAEEDVSTAVPLFDRAMLAAVLLVHGSKTESSRERNLISTLATAGGLALSAVRVVAMAEQREKQDPLTGLSGLSVIREILSDSLTRGPTAVLLVAADGIREVNEAYGRRVGDKVVASLARLVSFELRSEGQVGRYGGATLLVVLPGHRLDTALEVGQRMQRRVPASIVAGPEGLAEPLTISVGVAAGSVGPADVLLQEAERALGKIVASGGGGMATLEAVEGAKSNA